MDYTNLNSTWSAALYGAGFLPYVGTYINFASGSWLTGTAIVCGIGTIQYFQ